MVYILATLFEVSTRDPRDAVRFPVEAEVRGRFIVL